ncbi:MAG TPA: DUF2723 domain-containing protein [Flavisolibacter sp.]|nr:DUF2723 domain-containing protein [Flavisolibacter sp.]
MNFRKVNNIAGWAVCAIASLVYILTTEQRGSFWDCGEFVSACYKVQLPHPPGAPLFVLLGRFFIILFGDNPMTAAKAVNIMNALASGFTILFLFWTITHFARKLMTGLREEPNREQTLAIIGAGIVGGLAYTFSDSFWFSAVEGEVYALSSLFTAIAFWAMLKWERADDAAGGDRTLRNRADRWIVFLFFSLGLSIGVHLLGLLVIPAAVMIYYYKRYNYTQKGAIWAFVIGCLITGVVQVVVIKWTVILAGKFDIFFVNSFNLPFFSGFTLFFILLAVLVWAGLRWAAKRNYSYLRLGLWSFSFMMLGYSIYITTMERSNANPAMDMNNVDNPMSLVYYLGREQYGSQPLLMGPHYVAQYKRNDQGEVVFDEGKMRYAKGDDQYIQLGRESEPAYKDRDIQLFPRVWDPTNEQRHFDFYISWLNMGVITAKELSQVVDVDDDGGYIQVVNQAGKRDSYSLPENFRSRVNPGQVIQAGTPIAVEAPSYADNIQWFLTYQMGFMYWRYFMWNFAGRQNDIQGSGNVRDGNWISGISFVDNARLGDQSKLPESIQHNGATNKLFLIPFILGIVGCVYHFMKDRRDWLISFLLFFFTGVAIVLYLNQPGNQPRERDYAFAGSFYAYAIWIGLSVVAFARMAREREDKLSFNNVLIFGSLASFVIALMSNANGSFSGSLVSSFLVALVYAAVTAIISFVVKAAGKSNLRTAALAATVICLSAPIIMAAQEWNDHDRSSKLLAPDLARNYLESCPPNAILFTFGDNDTYPLWYAQEVEGLRPDVRIVNTSLLGIDWYVNQLRYKINESGPVDVIWSADQVRGLSYIRNQGGQNGGSQPLYDFMKNTVSPLLNTDGEGKAELRVAFPAKLTVPVDVNYVKSAGLVNADDQVLSQIELDISPNKSYFSLDQLTMMNVLATTNWRRPICFTSPYGETGFGPYLRQEGLIYRVVPVRVEREMDATKTYGLLMNKFRSGNADRPGIYFDEENRRHLLSIRSTYAFAATNLADQGRKKEALDLLNKAESQILPESLPYAMVSRYNQHNQTSLIYLEAAYKAGHKALADKLKAALRKDLSEQKAYFDYLRNNKEEFYNALADEEQINNRYLGILDQWEKLYSPGAATPVTEVPGQPRDSADSTRNR